MAVYVFNLLVGYEFSGVEHAQGYRAMILKKFMPSVKYIFTELPGRREINSFSKLGIDIEQMLSMHQSFTDNCTLCLSVKVNDKLEELKKWLHVTDIHYGKNSMELFKDNERVASILLDGDNFEYVSMIYYFSRGRLIRTEFYAGEGVCYADNYMTEKSGKEIYAKLVRRSFYNKNGTVVFDQIFEGKMEWNIFQDGKILTKPQMVAEFVRRLNLSESDTILLDRGAQLDFIQPLFKYKNKARLIQILHTGHYFEKGEDPHYLYLNWEYYYAFKYSRQIHAIVVSTQEQKEGLVKILREYGFHVPYIVVIPVGGLAQVRFSEGSRKSYSLLSVSRIDRRKKLEWMIWSVIKAHQKNSKISFDIYGNNNENNRYFQEIKKIVIENQAQSYIRFKGYVDVTDVYKKYEVYISTSTWETYGLSVMEAVGSGNALIGLDVKYGNRLFIHPDENGYLIPFDLRYIEDDKKLIDEMANRILDIFSDRDRLERFHQRSYEIANQFLSDEIENKWKNLLLYPEKAYWNDVEGK